MKNQYTAAIVGRACPKEDILSLEKYGYKVFIVDKNSNLEEAVSSHTDLSLFAIENHLFVSGGYYEKNKEIIDSICRFSSLSLIITGTEPASPYPYDTPFCAINCNGEYIIANSKSIAKEIKGFCRDRGINIIHTAQGYAKCTSLYFNGHLISADPSSLKAAESISLKTLKISSGGIDLPGYAYGFIGGCSGFDKENIYFCGNIDLHPNSDIIKAFIIDNGFNAVSLGEHKLLDIGSIIFI